MFSLNEIYKARCICSELYSFCCVFFFLTAIKFRFTNDSVNTTERKNKARATLCKDYCSIITHSDYH